MEQRWRREDLEMTTKHLQTPGHSHKGAWMATYHEGEQGLSTPIGERYRQGFKRKKRAGWRAV